MSACKFPEHHGKQGGAGSGLLVVLVVLAVLVLAAARFVVAHAWWFAGPAAAAVVSRLGVAVSRFACLGRGRRYYLAACWHSFRWRWLCRNLGLSYADRHRRAIRPVPFGTAAPVESSRSRRARVRFPRARFRADAYGLVAKVKTVPGVGRAELEEAAPHIADAWRCTRVQVAQRGPGRLIVRGLRTDPLTMPYSRAEAPPGVFGFPGLADARDLRLYVGRDEWGEHRWLPLPGVTGIAVGGLPGFGKTELIRSLIRQLSGVPVRWVFIDGKGSGDYAEFQDQAVIITGDELPAAAGALEDSHAEMRRRLGSSPGNAWHVGPTLAMPLWATVIDECHTFFDLDAAKSDRAKAAETHVRACRTFAGQLVRKGRSVLMLTIVITQKQTSDAIPTAIRDNCRAGFSFAVKTRDAAVAALGEHIREYPSYCPTSLQDEAYVGVCTASMRTGADPFVRIRVPALTSYGAWPSSWESSKEASGSTAEPSRS